MSWFKRKPIPRQTPSPAKHHRYSAATARLLKETKEATKPSDTAQPKQKPTQ
jgi:hypothetical protein